MRGCNGTGTLQQGETTQNGSLEGFKQEQGPQMYTMVLGKNLVMGEREILVESAKVPVVFESENGKEKGEVEGEGTLMLFGSNKNPTEGEELIGDDLMPICTIPPLSSNWVMQKVEEIHKCVGISCEGYEDQFKALLTANEAGHYHHGIGSKRNRELRKLT